MSTSGNLITVVENAYDVEAPEEHWLEQVVASIHPYLDRGLGMLAFTFDGRSLTDDWIGTVLGTGDSQSLAAMVRGLYAALPVELRGMLLYRTPPVGLASHTVSSGAPVDGSSFPGVREFTQPLQIADAVAITATARAGSGVVIGAPARELFSLHRQQQGRLEQIAAHVGAAARLREALRVGTVAEPEAVLDSEGRVHHARGVAATTGGRKTLRDAVLAMDRARSRNGRRDPDAALAYWRALVDGRWSLVDRFESDGRRFLVALENAPAQGDPRGLTLRERSVATYVARGYTNKLIAYTLGLSESTIGVLVGRIVAKVGARSRAEAAQRLIEWEIAAQADVARLQIGDQQAVVLSRAIERGSPLGLTPRQFEIARAAVDGKTNEEIAAMLGLSVYTVANTLARVYRKTGAASRASLGTALFSAISAQGDPAVGSSK